VKPGWVYIVECSDGSYYTGSTTELDVRFVKHQQGFWDGYTAARRPVTLRWSADFPDIRDAIDAEKQIKGWSRAKKEALMKGDLKLLHELAKCRNETRSDRPRDLDDGSGAVFD
jgi:predicted GIY-YIG superfamily endonuclease